ncbi:MAG: asparaginase [Bacteroidota bacterium]|nr:asparaginase [Bacteroidota bacterium]
MKTKSQIVNPILVNKFRGEVLESYHRGIVCLINTEGNVVFSRGDIEQVCYPRSALKLFQVIPLLESGVAEHFDFTLEEIAIMCGSHNGESEHRRVVNQILAKIGLSYEYLLCGSQHPALYEDRAELILNRAEPDALHNNCSGKHAGFLAYCKFHNLPLDSYLDKNHEIHKRIMQVVADMHEVPIESMHIGIDGCSTPIFSLSVYAQAKGYANLLNPAKFGPERIKTCQTIIKAVTTYPYLIAGRHRYCTELMEIGNGKIFGKTGADGIYSMGFLNLGLACCIKIEDGLMGPQYAVAQQIVKNLGILNSLEVQELEKYRNHDVKNWNKWSVGTEIANEDEFQELLFMQHSLNKNA